MTNANNNVNTRHNDEDDDDDDDGDDDDDDDDDDSPTINTRLIPNRTNMILVSTILRTVFTITRKSAAKLKTTTATNSNNAHMQAVCE